MKKFYIYFLQFSLIFCSFIFTNGYTQQNPVCDITFEKIGEANPKYLKNFNPIYYDPSIMKQCIIDLINYARKSCNFADSLIKQDLLDTAALYQAAFMAKKEEVNREWYVIDATGKPLGRVASQAAILLRGKHKPTYTPHVDTGDYVIVINAELVEVTGKKADKKIYRRHTSYPGGLRESTFRQVMEKKPTFVVYEAVRGMLPHGRLGRDMLKKLKVYAGPAHHHEAQKPEMLEL